MVSQLQHVIFFPPNRQIYKILEWEKEERWKWGKGEYTVVKFSPVLDRPAFPGAWRIYVEREFKVPLGIHDSQPRKHG